MKISVIIVNYQTKDDLFKCIDSINRSKPKTNFEIIVIDNSEKSIKKELLKKFSKVKYIKSRKNVGYGGGNNLGASIAKGKYLFFLNPDTKFENDVLDILYGFLKKEKNAGAVSPLLLKEDGSLYIQGSKELSPINAIFGTSFIHKLFPNNSISRKFWLKDWNKKDTREVHVAPGTALMISKELFERVGKFDEEFFLYFEENDLCRKIRRLGYKIFIHPSAKVFHKLGVSTSKNAFSSKYFKKSRFLYFRKHYGLIKAVFTEIILRINKNLLLLTSIVLVGLFLRVYKLSELMPFIGDQAWYYISARDMIVTGDIPLVGITSSHIWLHQGAYWTYLLALLFKLFNFNPVAPSYFIVLLGVATIALVYKLAREMFDERIALVSSFIFATSPLIVTDARFAYHTSPIPFFTALFLLSVFRWINKKAWYFPFVVLLLAILYNLEIATFSLSGVVILFLLFGLVKRKKWALGIINKKILLCSLIVGLIPLIPFILYDIKNGFPQTIKVVIWIFYRIAVFLGYPPINDKISGETWITWSGFITDLIRKLVFYPSTTAALIILGISFLFLFFSVIRQFKDKEVNISYVLIFVSFFIPAVSYIGAKTNSGAYLLIFYPQVSIMLGVLFGSKLKNNFFGQTLIFAAVLIGLVNAYSVLKNNFHPGTSFSEKVEASNLIIRKASGRNYNILGKGEGSEHESFTMPYEYLTWWLGQPPSGKNEKLKFYLDGNTDRIEFEKR